MSLPIKIIICVFGIVLLGGGSGYFAGSATTQWYNDLNKPFFQPPSWVFGPAWTLLYTLMGIALARVWHVDSDSKFKRLALIIFAAQFILNLIWSPLFFYAHRPDLALIIIVVLWFLIIMTMRLFKKVDKIAAYLFIPYLMWVTFATMLNLAIVYLNT